MLKQLVLATVVVVGLVAVPAAENWPQWRGPTLNGLSAEKNLPVRWSPTENIAWKLALPAWSGSTPIVWGDRIFLNVADGRDLYLWCGRVGGQIRIDATLHDYKRQRTVPLKAEAPTEKELLKAVDELARSIQQNVAASPDVVKELQANAFKPSSTSVQALRDYNEGLQLGRRGNNLEALKRFESATNADPDFALAYSRLAQIYANLGQDTEAEHASRRAVGLSQKLPPRERYLIGAAHARILNDNEKAIEAYENLVKVAPDDSDASFSLGRLFEDTGALDKARGEYARVLARDPKFVNGLFAMGRVEIRRGNAQAALEYLNNALRIIAFRIVSSLRIQAMRATFFGLPAATRRR